MDLFIIEVTKRNDTIRILFYFFITIPSFIDGSFYIACPCILMKMNSKLNLCIFIIFYTIKRIRIRNCFFYSIIEVFISLIVKIIQTIINLFKSN